MQTEFSKRVLSKEYARFTRPDPDIVALLDVWSRQNDSDFTTKDEVVTNFLVRKALRRVRWERRTYIAQQVYRHIKRRLYGMFYPRYVLTKEWLRRTAKIEESLQQIETSVMEQPSSRTKKFAEDSVKARAPDFNEDK